MPTSLQEGKIKKIAEEAAIRAVRRVLADPDFGLELRPDFEKKLKKSITSKTPGCLKGFKAVLTSL